MADFQFSSLLTETHRLRDNFPQYPMASQVNEWQVRSLPSLLATPDAVGLLISFLRSDRPRNLLWLSDSFCISKDYGLNYSLDDEGKQGSIQWFFAIGFRATTDEYRRGMYLYGLRSAELSTLVPVTDALFQLLAWNKTLYEVGIFPNIIVPFARLPVSFPALETFLGQAKSRRTVHIQIFSLSTEQCRLLAFGCNEKVNLVVRNNPQLMELLSFLTESLNLNQSPKRLHIVEFGNVSDDIFNAFLAAVEDNTSLLELGVPGWSAWNAPRHAALFRAIGRNKGLQRLDLEGTRLSDTEWKTLWEECLSRHSTIRTINIERTLTTESEESDSNERRDEVMAASILTNSVLTEIQYTENDHTRTIMEQKVLPILALNRFRPHVQAIKQEEDQERRRRVFTMTLLRDEQVCNRPAFLYLLLNQNPDMLVQRIQTPDDVVVEMDDSGMSLPSSGADSAPFTRKRKR